MLKFLAALIFIYWVYKVIRRFYEPEEVERDQQNNNMIACRTCGVYVPESEAFVKNKQFYCCRGHMPK